MNSKPTNDIDPPLPDELRKQLSHRQEAEVEAEYRDIKSWYLEYGKNPTQSEGLSEDAARSKMSRLARCHAWVLNHREGSKQLTHADANRVEEALVENRLTTQGGDNYAESSKRKMLEALSSYFLYRAHVHGGQPWTPDASFNQTDYNQSDYFTLREREQLYDSALEYGDPGDVDNLSEEELDDLKQQLSESLKKPKEEVSEADIRQRRENWKVPSLISVALDLGLRPIEIERFETTWFRPGKSTIYIPSEKAAKNVSSWEVGLSSRSDRILRWWLKQREERENYAESKRMWLNSVGNPYNSGSLNHLLRNLIDIADIDTEGRKLNWYSIRRSTGVYLTYFHSLAYTKEQLRHNSLQSTLRYVEIPTEARQQVLDALQGGLPLGGHGGLPTPLGPEELR